jgi:hypothetical protein
MFVASRGFQAYASLAADSDNFRGSKFAEILLDDQMIRAQFPVGDGNFSLHHHIQNSSGACPASYPMGTRGSFPGGKADHSPLSSAKVKECVVLYLHSPNTSPWHGA